MQYNCNKIFNKPQIAVVFDVDGNIIDTEKNQHIFYHEALQNIFKNNAEIISKIEKILPCNDQGQKWYIENLMGNVPEHQRILSETFAPISNEQLSYINKFVAQRIQETITPQSVFPGIQELFQRLSQDVRVEVYLVSGGSHDCIFGELEKTGLMPYLKKENIYTIETYQHGKGEKLAEILKQLNITPNMMIMSGDSIKDMQSTRNLADGKDAYAIGNLGTVGLSNNPQFMHKRRNILIKAGANEVIGTDQLCTTILLNVERISQNTKPHHTFKPSIYLLATPKFTLPGTNQQER